MSTASLLVMGSDPRSVRMYWFEEAMTHRKQLGAMAPLTRFSALPYFIDPPLLDDGMWKLNHAQAQNDAISTSPTWDQPGPPAYPGTLRVSVPEAQILIMTDFEDPGQRTWFTFANHYEQFVAEGFLPALLTLPAW